MATLSVIPANKCMYTQFYNILHIYYKYLWKNGNKESNSEYFSWVDILLMSREQKFPFIAISSKTREANTNIKFRRHSY